MAQGRNRAREAREARDRLMLYNARQSVYAHQRRRRRRDNIIAVVSVLVVAALAAVTQIVYFSAGPGAPTSSASPSASATAAAGQNVGDVPSASVAENRTWTGSITLNKVALSISLDGAKAPQAVASVVTDIKNGYYVGKTCHRLVDDSTGAGELIQCGSLDGTGAGDSSYSFGPVENAPTDNVYTKGTIALARGDSEYSQDHQFFIMLGDATLGSAPGYTVIGTVTKGLDTLIASNIVTAGLTPTSSSDANDGAPKTKTTITAASIK